MIVVEGAYEIYYVCVKIELGRGESSDYSGLRPTLGPSTNVLRRLARVHDHEGCDLNCYDTKYSSNKEKPVLL